MNAKNRGSAFAQRLRHGWPRLLQTFNAQRRKENGSQSLVTSAPTGEKSFLTKRTQFLQKTIVPQLAANMGVAEIVLCKSVGFLYTKRTQFFGERLKAEG